MHCKLSLCAALLLALPALHAEEPQASQMRSGATYTAALMDPGAVALELGGDQLYLKDDSRIGAITAQLDLGLTSWVDLRCGWRAYAWNYAVDGDSNQGLSDLYVGGQLLFLKQNKIGMDLGLVYRHTIPRGAAEKGLSTGFHEDLLQMVFSRSMGPWAVDANLGLKRTQVDVSTHEHGTERRNVTRNMASCAVIFAPAQDWNVLLDHYFVSKSNLDLPNDEQEFATVLGLAYEVNKRLRLDATVLHGWTDAAPDFAFSAGLIYQFGQLWGN